jgi:hypothetical protein
VKFFGITWNIPQTLWTVQDFLAIFVSIMAAIFFFTLIGLLGFHTYLISINVTTNEHLRSNNDKTIFNKGCRENWKEVFC